MHKGWAHALDTFFLLGWALPSHPLFLYDTLSLSALAATGHTRTLDLGAGEHVTQKMIQVVEDLSDVLWDAVLRAEVALQAQFTRAEWTCILGLEAIASGANTPMVRSKPPQSFGV